jgi:hypothetical protein
MPIFRPLFLSLSKVFTISAQISGAKNCWARSLVRTRHRPAEPGILGSNPSGPATLGAHNLLLCARGNLNYLWILFLWMSTECVPS